jgi:hypothetical protein
MSTTTQARFRAAIVAIAPAVLLFAFVYHPYIANLTDKAAVAAALSSDTTRWGLSHLAVGVGSGLAVLAFLAIRGYLREAGEERSSILALPFIVIGSTLFAFLPAMEIAMLAVADEGADVQAVLTALDSWFFPILVAGAITFALGVLGFAVGIVRGGVLGPRLTWLVVGALFVMAAARFVPLGAALYVGAWPASWRCGRWHTRCGSTLSPRDPLDSRDRCRRPDSTNDLRRVLNFTDTFGAGP